MVVLGLNLGPLSLKHESILQKHYATSPAQALISDTAVFPADMGPSQAGWLSF